MGLDFICDNILCRSIYHINIFWRWHIMDNRPYQICMIKTHYICDHCNISNHVKSYRIDDGCEMDPSGNGYNTNWKYVDLCPKCYKDLVNNDLDIKIYKNL